ncbi:MAG TPA: class F sortase [Candidatus Saccharimonadales bacterium]
MKMRISKRGAGIICLAVALAGAVAGGAAFLRHSPHVQTQPPRIKHVVTESAPPSELPITKASYVSTAGPLEPSYISLPTISAEGFVQKMGIDQRGEIATPTNVNFAGWYVNSVPPGQPGLSIIVGHLDGRTSPGIFLHLNKLKPQDTFSVALGNGTLLSYSVRTVTTTDNAHAVAALFSQDPTIKSQLNLITCGGSFSRATSSYDARVIVSAALNSR